jgi:uncharacterized membrane protein YdjX (TVP38/TMEM64 family)
LAQPETTEGRPRFGLKRLAPLVVLVLGLGVFFAFDLDRFVSFEALRDNRAVLSDFVERHSLLAAVVFIATYAVVVAFSLPIATLLSIMGGFFFGTPVGTLCVVIGATVGAVALFLIARSTLGAFLHERAGAALKRMEAGFRENEFSYLLILRLIPLFPFFLVNIVPALLGVRLRTYVLATAIGIVPGAFVYVGVGAGTGSVLDSGEVPGLSIFFRADVILPMIGLAVLALLPVAYKILRRSRPGRPIQ